MVLYQAVQARPGHLIEKQLQLWNLWASSSRSPILVFQRNSRTIDSWINSFRIRMAARTIRIAKCRCRLAEPSMADRALCPSGKSSSRSLQPSIIGRMGRGTRARNGERHLQCRIGRLPTCASHVVDAIGSHHSRFSNHGYFRYRSNAHRIRFERPDSCTLRTNAS